MKVLLLVFLLVHAPAVLAAQTVVGELVERETGAPVAGAFIFLVDADGQRAGGTMTSRDGRFQIRARRPGRYALRAERIGYETIESEPLELTARAVVRHRFTVETRPFELEGIHVEADRRCVVRPEDGRQVARVWEEASKALRATAVTEQEELYIFVARAYRNQLDPQRLEVTAEESWERVLVAAVPYVSIDPDRMAETGFMHATDEETLFFGPDAALLLSDPFLDTHCLRLSSSAPARPDWIGIEFEPVEGRDVPDIAGVVWLDRATAELRRIDYEYVGPLPFPGRSHRAGGRIDFERLPTGGWIVRSWWIRLPHVGAHRLPGGRRSYRVEHYQVEGAEVLEVLDRDGRPVEGRQSSAAEISTRPGSD